MHINMRLIVYFFYLLGVNTGMKVNTISKNCDFQ